MGRVRLSVVALPISPLALAISVLTLAAVVALDSDDNAPDGIAAESATADV